MSSFLVRAVKWIVWVWNYPLIGGADEETR